MNWLIDAQLPPRLCAWLNVKGETSRHVSELEAGLRSSDEMIWNHSRNEGMVIVSKDRDFFERSLLYGAPPQVLYINVGNCSNERLMMILEHVWDAITLALKQEHPLVALTQTGIQKH